MNNLLLIVLLFYYVELNGGVCPSGCKCTSNSVRCTNYTINQVPRKIPETTRNLIISNQYFVNPVLSYNNISLYDDAFKLQELTIRNCGITNIEGDTFSHLLSLKLLDLSGNNLKLITTKALNNLYLDKLILDNNLMLILKASSFKGLSVKSLSMKNCNLENISYQLLLEIIRSLKMLDISDNKVTTLPKELKIIFNKLTHLTMNTNMFKCDCRLKWLHKTYKDKQNSLSANFSPFICSSPLNMKGKAFDKLFSESLTCPKPIIDKILIDVKSANKAILVCKTLNNADNTVYWYSYKNNPDKKLVLLNKSLGQSIITVNKSSDHAKPQFRCRVSNDYGNAGLDFKLNWLKEETEKPVIKYNYTLFELILSIVSTCIITTATFATLYLIFANKCISMGYINGNQYMTKNQPPSFLIASKYSQNRTNHQNNICSNLNNAPLSINGTSSNELYSGGDSLIYDLPQHLPSPAINNRINNSHNNNDNMNL